MESQSNRAVILFTDLKGYSSFVERDPLEAMEFMEFHDQLLGDAIRAHQGRVIKTIGDAFMAEFPKADVAVACAESVQEAMHRRNRALPRGQRRYVRIGIHEGEVYRKGQDIFGGAVNLAARLESRCLPGGILVSKAVQEKVAFTPGLTLIPRPGLKLKNMGRQDAWQVWSPGMDPAAGRAPFEGRRLAGALAAAGLLVAVLAGTWGLGRFKAWREDRRWELYYAEDKSSIAGLAQRWLNARVDVEPGGGLRLKGRSILASYSVVPAQPLRLEVEFELQAGAAYLELGPAFRVEPDPLWQERPEAAPYARDGYLAKEEFLPASGLSQVRLGAIAQPTGAFDFMASTARDARPRRRLKRVLTVGGDSLELGDGRRTLSRALLRHRPGLEGRQYRIAVGGRGIVLHSLKVWRVKADEEVGLVAAAEDYRLRGELELARRLYRDLERRARNAEAAARFAFKVASLEPAPRSEQALRQVAEAYAGRSFGGFAHYELARAALSAGRWEEAESILVRFRAAYPTHPFYTQAGLGLLSAMTQQPQRESQARALGWLLLEESESAYDLEVLDLLEERVWSRDARGALDELQARLKPERDPWRRGALGLAIAKRALAQRADDALVALSLDLVESDPPVPKALLRRSLYHLFKAMRTDPERAAALHGRIAATGDRAYRLAVAGADYWYNQRELGMEAYMLPRQRVRSGGPADGPQQLSLDRLKLVPFGAHADSMGVSLDGGKAALRYRASLDSGRGLLLFSADAPSEAGKPAQPVLDGASKLRWKLKVGKGQPYSISVSEVGVGPLDQEYPSASPDGEVYAWPGLQGTGAWQELELAFDQALLFPYWGNQAGDRTLDLSAILQLSVQLGPSSKDGAMELEAPLLVP